MTGHELRRRKTWRETDMDEDYIIRGAKTLRDFYGWPHDAAIAKQVDYLHPLYQEFIRASPFLILAAGGQDGFDASPRGDAPEHAFGRLAVLCRSGPAIPGTCTSAIKRAVWPSSFELTNASARSKTTAL
jgi:hypothetical protein